MATRTRLTIDLTPEQRRRIRQAAAARDMTVSEFVSAAVDEKLGEREESREERIKRGIEAIERLEALRKTLPKPRPGDQTAADILREEREKRTEHLLGAIGKYPLGSS